MNRFLFFLLLIGFGFNSSSVKADPIVPNTTGNAINTANEKPKQPLNVKAKDKLIQKTPLRTRHRVHYTVGDFGPLPTNSDRPKNHDDGTAPPHPSDFGTVPIESGPDTRRAK